MGQRPAPLLLLDLELELQRSAILSPDFFLQKKYESEIFFVSYVIY